MEKEKDELDEKEKLFYNVTGKEWDWIRTKAGLFCRAVGEKAVEIGSRDKPFHPTTVSRWKYKPVINLMRCELLYLCMRPENWTMLRKEYKKLNQGV